MIRCHRLVGWNQVRNLYKAGAFAGCFARFCWLFCQIFSFVPGPLENRGHSTLPLLSISRHKRLCEFLKGGWLWFLLEELGVKMLPSVFTLNLTRKAAVLEMTHGCPSQHSTTEVRFQALEKQ